MGRDQRCLGTNSPCRIANYAERAIAVDRSRPVTVQIPYNPTRVVIADPCPDHGAGGIASRDQFFCELSTLPEQRAGAADMYGLLPAIWTSHIEVPIIRSAFAGWSRGRSGWWRFYRGGRDLRRMLDPDECGGKGDGHSRLRGCRGHSAVAASTHCSGGHQGCSTVPGNPALDAGTVTLADLREVGKVHPVIWRLNSQVVTLPLRYIAARSISNRFPMARSMVSLSHGC